MIKKLVAVSVMLGFLLSTGIASAAQVWVVVKDSKGVCKVISSKGATPKTIAGPFNTKKEAEAAKVEKCPKKGGK